MVVHRAHAAELISAQLFSEVLVIMMQKLQGGFDECSTLLQRCLCRTALWPGGRSNIPHLLGRYPAACQYHHSGGVGLKTQTLCCTA
jgi:hypothetical protein